MARPAQVSGSGWVTDKLVDCLEGHPNTDKSGKGRNGKRPVTAGNI